MKRLNNMIVEKELKRKKLLEDEIIAKNERGEATEGNTDIASQTTQPNDAKSVHRNSQPEISTRIARTERVKSASLASRF
jgi:hypothetical protein